MFNGRNINEVIKTVLNFFHDKILPAKKREKNTKHQKHQNHQKAQKVQKRK